MRAAPGFLVALLTFLLVGPAALAAGPNPMILNGSSSADTKGSVVGVSLDGPGRLAGVAVADEATNLQDQDLLVYNLQSESRAWEAADTDLPNEGGKMVAIANGTGGEAGGWLILVNGTATNQANWITAYAGSGFGPGGAQGRFTWLHRLDNSIVNDVDITSDGALVAVATGVTTQNKSLFLIRNRFEAQGPLVLARINTSGELSEVTAFTSVALGTNATVPAVASNQRAAYMVAGARTISTQGLSRGLVVVYEVNWTNLENPQMSRVITFETNSPVEHVAITADGEYAVAGTEEGQVYLFSVSQALQRRGIQGIDLNLRPWQQSLGGGLADLDIAPWGREVIAAATEAGDIFIFRNQLNPGQVSRSDGAQGIQVGRANVATPFCNPRLAGPVDSLALSDFGDHVVVGARNGMLSFEAGALARLGLGATEPAWCIPFAQGDVNNGVRVDISGDGRRVVAGTGHRVFGYNNFYRIALEPDAARRAGSPGQRVQWALNLRNDGSLFDRVNLSAQGPLDPGWQFALSNSSLLLMPGKSQTVLLNVTSPQGIAPGNFTINVVATGERSGIPLSQTLRLDLGQLRRVEILPPNGTLIASAGSETPFPITLRNGGNAADRFRVFAQIPAPEQNFKSPGSEWTVRMDPIEVEIPANSHGVVNLRVTPQAQRGHFAYIDVSVEFAVNPEGLLGDTKRVQVAVEPSYNGDINLAEPRDYRAEPGQQIFINFTVKNLGNTQDVFEVQNRTEPANAPGWRLTLTDERFELRTQNQQKTVRMTVFAQQGLQPGESVRIVVDLFSDGLQRQNPSSDGKVDSQSVTVTVIPRQRSGLPLAPEPLVLLGVVAVALLARRRVG